MLCRRATVNILEGSGGGAAIYDRPRASAGPSLLGLRMVTHDRDGGKRGPGWYLSRRAFLGHASAAGAVVTAGALLPARKDESPSATASVEPVAEGTVPVALTVNGTRHELQLEPRVTLLDALREVVGLPGTKKGCDHGQCGACTVHVNDRRVNACLTFAIMHQDDRISTIEGLARNGELHPMQAAFLEHDGFQCGYCTPGQIMSATALLGEPCAPDDDAVRECMSGNICRCGAYTNIVAAIQSARAAGATKG
jgi:xanthine dehydrogenase YagT iron-sulfur-binding subunit